MVSRGIVAAGDDQSGNFGQPLFLRNIERCFSELIPDIPFCSTIKQEFHNFCVSLFNGLMQRRTTHVADGVHIGAAFD